MRHVASLNALDSPTKAGSRAGPSQAPDAGQRLPAFAPYVACSAPVFLRAIERAERYAADPTATLLLEGESGTGKTVLARHLHDVSPRRRAPFESLPLSAVEDSLAGSDLFGHVAGAFTDARGSRVGRFLSANGGTIFLDEVGKASASLQRKLLHAVEYHEIRPLGADRDVRVDVRVMAATNIPLEQMVERGEFLPDLAARLTTFRVRLPSLRDRRDDIPHLVRGYVAKRALAAGYVEPPAIADELMAALAGAPWPYNLRQLDATVHRLLLDAEGAQTITLGHCQEDLAYLREAHRALEPLTVDRIADALRTTGSKSAAARKLGVDRTTLHRHLRRQGPATEG